MTKNNVRESGIELLRILSVMGVIILHFNGSYGHALEMVDKNSINYVLLIVLENIFISSVNVFVLISGFFLSSTNHRKLSKPISLVFQVMIWGFGMYLVSVIMGWKKLSIFSLIASVLPCNYFVILYTVLFIVSPYINRLIENLNDKQLIKFTITVFGMFSVWPTIVDVIEEITDKELMGLSSIGMYGSQNGYTIVNFCMLYIIGATIQRMKFDIPIKKICFSAIVIQVLLFGWAITLDETAWAYSNPLIIIWAVIVFLAFKKLDFRSKLINKLSKSTFTCFLLHGYFFAIIDVARIINKNVFVLLSFIVVLVIIIYFVCYLCYIIYYYISEKLLKSVWNMVDKINITIS